MFLRLARLAEGAPDDGDDDDDDDGDDRVADDLLLPGLVRKVLGLAELLGALLHVNLGIF